MGDPAVSLTSSRSRQEPVTVPYSSDRNDGHKFFMPDLPGDPYGRDTDLYPPVPKFHDCDLQGESDFDADFSSERFAPDLVVHDSYSKVPSAKALRAGSDDRIHESGPRSRGRRSYRDHQLEAQPTDTMDIVYDDASVRTSIRSGNQHDTITSTSLQASTTAAEFVPGTRQRGRRRSLRKDSRRGGGGGASWGWSRIVMPSFRQMLEQVLPSLVMAVSLLIGLTVIDRVPALEGMWAPIVLAPSVALFFLANAQTQPMWRRNVLMNLGAVGVFYPLLIVRQSYLRIPYVEWGNGTLRMPMVSTLTVIGLLLTIAFVAAWMSQEDPEYAGVLFLPAALLVPFFAGATEIVSLRTALIIAISVFAATGILTIIASVLPGAYPMLVAPVALAIEFFVLPLSDSVPIFPLGAGLASKLMFFIVLATTVGLTVGMPNLAAWVRQVRDIVTQYESQPAR